MPHSTVSVPMTPVPTPTGRARFSPRCPNGVRSLTLALFALVVAAMGLMAGLTVALTAGPAVAQGGGGVYRVEGVDVSAKGKTGDQAKERALALGRRAAFERLMGRITLAKDRVRLPRPSAAVLRDLVAGFEVEDETAGATEYRGKVTFRFNKARVEQLLTASDVGFVQAGGRPVLMLPVWQTGATPLLWDDPNPWRQAWRKLDPDAGTVKYAQPRGDLADLQAISGQQALQLDRTALAAIAKRYKAAVVLVSHARREGGKVQIRVMRFDVDAGTVSTVGSYDSARSDGAMAATARKIAAAFEATWKTSNVVPSGPSTKLRVVAPLSGLAYWIRLRDTMAKVRVVRDQRIVRLSPEEAEIELTYVGGLDALRNALRQSGIELTDGTPQENGDLGASTVRLSGGPAGGGDTGSGTTPTAPGDTGRALPLPRPRTE